MTRFVVATRSFLALVDLASDATLRRFERLEDGRHYGIALTGNGDGSFDAVDRKRRRLVTYRRNGAAGPSYRPAEEAPLSASLADVHQIAACGSGVYVANSGPDTLEWISFDGTRHHRLCFGETDSRHINSIFPYGADRAAVVLHNKGEKNSEVGFVRRSPEGLELVRLVSLWDMGCHNVYLDPHGSLLAYNASEIGDFVVVDLDSGRVRRRLQLSGHTKGLSVTPDWFVVGISEYASRWARNTSRGRLAVIDRSTLKLEGVVDLNHPSLPHPIGNVNEIRCLAAPELGHAGPCLERPAEEIRLDPGNPAERRLRTLRRLGIETLKSVKLLWVTVREATRRASSALLGPR